jgi:subfamily B ATP-binding cassette protein MsbA
MRFKLPIPVRNFIKTTSFWRENRLILREFKHFRQIAILALVFSLLGAFLTGISVGLIASFLQGLTNPESPPMRIGLDWFDTWFLATKAPPSERIIRLSVFMLLIIWLRSVFIYLGQLHSKDAELHLGNNLRARVFEQLESLSLSFYSQTRAGDLLNTVRGEVTQVQQAFNVFATVITQGSTLLAYLLSMILISWQLSTASIMLFSLLAVGLSNVRAKVRESSFKVPKANKNLTSVCLEYINGIRTVHASTTQDFERERFDKANEQVMIVMNEVFSLSLLVNPVIQGMSTTMLIGLVLVAFNFLVKTGELQAASLLTFLFALSRTTPLISQVSTALVKFNTFQGALHNVEELLKCDNKPYLKEGKVEFSGLKQSIDLLSVDFGYDPNEPVLHDITLSIRKGQTIALVGASGAGKTTLADLIPRFQDPTQGKILIDGVDLREFRINSLRQKMAIVSQDTFIFNRSVRDNIAYGVTDVDEDAVREAAQLANALEFILELPEGFGTVLGDRGVRLSGGQRQRIAIARAILRNPEILILDEATSALDSVTERLIQESLEQLSKGRTVIAIAHRLSTIIRADKVVVLEQGRIVEQGEYQELLERQGKLWKYHQMQYEFGQVG